MADHTPERTWKVVRPPFDERVSDVTATLRAEVGPVDDDGHLYVNGQEVVGLGLNASPVVHQQDLEDGDHNIRFVVINSGGWAWRAKLRLIVSGDVLANVDQSGNSGFWSGTVYERQWQIRISDGELDTF